MNVAFVRRGLTTHADLGYLLTISALLFDQQIFCDGQHKIGMTVGIFKDNEVFIP